MKISVIIPVYNLSAHLETCFSDILAQTLQDFEVICVDDGSTDNSIEILRSYEQKDDRIKVLTQQNQFAGVARNHGMEIASGKYLLFLDGDDRFAPTMLEQLYVASEEVSADVCVCGGRICNFQTGRMEDRRDFLDIDMLPDKKCFSAEEIADHIFNFTFGAAWNKLFLREFVEKNNIKFLPLQRAQDNYFTFTALALAARITYVGKDLMTYSQYVENSLTRATFNQVDLCFFEALKTLRETLIAHGLEKKYRKSFCNRAITMCIFQLNKKNTRESYIAFHDQLRSVVFPELHLIEHGWGYYYNKNHFKRMVDVLDMTGEEAWERMSENTKVKAAVLVPDQFEALLQQKELQDRTVIKVSVIIAAYNVENYIMECLNSLLSQTLEGIEIICVNDASDDNTLSILKQYQAKDDRIVILDLPHGGISAARNAGLKAAKGEYVHFLDGDDYMDPRSYEILYKKAADEELDMLLFGAETFYDPPVLRYQKGIIHPNYQKKYRYDMMPLEGRTLYCEMKANGDYCANACLYLMKRRFAEEKQLRFEEGLTHEDEVFTLKSLALAQKTEHLNIMLHHRRIRENSIMTSMKGQKELILKDSFEYLKGIKLLSSFYQQHQIYRDNRFASAYLKGLTHIHNQAIKHLKGDKELNTRFEAFKNDLDIELMPVIFTISEKSKESTEAYNAHVRLAAMKYRDDLLRMKEEEIRRQSDIIRKKDEKIVALKKEQTQSVTSYRKRIYHKVKKILSK